MSQQLSNDGALWYKDAIIYEVPVKSFADSNGDGIGDLPGLITKLDYLQALGITAIWLLPFFPSPQRDDGYDVSDYTSINPTFGTLEDFQKLVQEAHARRIRVIIELVINHTSDQHPWFQRARKAPAGSPEREFYVWSDTSDRYQNTRIIFQDFEISNWSWDPVARSHYWHRFFSHQPDLNFDNPAVQKAVLEILDFWLQLGVDGFRLDAVPYLYEREGTNCENLPETHVFLKQLRSYIDLKYPNIMLLAEANQWPEDAVAYMGDGDECHMDFHFPLMPRLFMAIQQEDRFPIVDILQQTPPIPETCQWAIFLRNHDELTLEMVTDEDRDYMYRVYAMDPRARINLGIRRRLAPLLGNNRRSIELMNGLLFSLPGTPVLYYGDEIGMGDNIYLGDRNGVRTPMQWSADRNAGFSQTSPQRLFLPIVIEPEYHYEAVNVETQRANSNSLWWWMKRLIAVRKRFLAFGRGEFQMLYPDNRKVLVFLRTYAQENILVVVNLSRYSQCVELDLSAYEGLVPVEVFGRTEFPAIGKLPYFLTLGAYSFYWFSLEQQPSGIVCVPGPRVPVSTLLSVEDRWQAVFTGDTRTQLEQLLPNYLCGQPWFHRRTQVVQNAHILDVVMSEDGSDLALVIVEVEFAVGNPETYLLPLIWIPRDAEPQPLESQILAQIQVLNHSTGALADALRTRGFMLQLLHRSQPQIPLPEDLTIRFLKARDSILQVVIGEQLLMTTYRQVERGIHPAWELGQHFTHHPIDPPILPFLASVQHQSLTLAVIQEYLPIEGDAWSYTLDNLAQYFERLLLPDSPSVFDPLPALPAGSILEWSQLPIPDLAYAAIGDYLESARLLGQCTAHFHQALAIHSQEPAFTPEPFTTLYQRSIYQSMRNLVGQVQPALERRAARADENTTNQLAQTVLHSQTQIIQRFRRLLPITITATRTRVHGNYHLGQLLFSGKDFRLSNLSGDLTRPLSERRIKRSPLRDVAGLLYSLYYAIRLALKDQQISGVIGDEQMTALEHWSRFWYCWVAAAFWGAYWEIMQPTQVLPLSSAELYILLDVFLLEECFLELNYTLQQPAQAANVDIPLRAILYLLQGEALTLPSPGDPD